MIGSESRDPLNVSQGAAQKQNANPCLVGIQPFRPGERDLVEEADNPHSNLLRALRKDGSPELTTSFVISVIQIPDYMPEEEKQRLARTIIQYADVFS